MLPLWLVALLLAVPALSAPPAAFPPQAPPEKLSDLYKFLSHHVRRGLSATVTVWPIRLRGRTAEIMRAGNFFEAEMTLKPFEMQGLSFEKGEIFLKDLKVDPEALRRWELKVLDYREAQTRLIFTLRSLERKLAETGLGGPQLSLKADSAERVIEIRGRGRLLGVPCPFLCRAGLKWDESSKQLTLKAKSISWAGLRLPRWLWWLGSRTVPREPILDLGGTWIPLNIQEIYVGWDRVNLSTNW